MGESAWSLVVFDKKRNAHHPYKSFNHFGSVGLGMAI
jgi:hypothetical protein